MKLKTLPLSEVKKGTRILMRVDLNVPMQDGKISKGGDLRIRKIIPEVNRLRKKGAKIILVSHLGRPKGKVVRSLSLKPVAERMSRLMKEKVLFSEKIVGEEVEEIAGGMLAGDVLMLENVRFEKRELENSSALATHLARLGDIYMNNAFASSHRKHASISAITKRLPSYAGSLVVTEVKELSKKLEEPFFLLLGGVKLETKIDLIKKLAPKAQAVLLGGGIGAAFCKEKLNITCDLFELHVSKSELKLARAVSKKFSSKIVLPLDVKFRDDFGKIKVCNLKRLPEHGEIIDIGPETVKLYSRLLRASKSVVWNGSLGVTEHNRGKDGTRAMAKSIGKLNGSRSIVGGGDTTAFLDSQNLTEGFDFVSTGGGAMLTFLSGKMLPGLKPLLKK